MSRLWIGCVFFSAVFLGCVSQEVHNENLPVQEVQQEPGNNNEEVAKEQVVTLKIIGMT